MDRAEGGTAGGKLTAKTTLTLGAAPFLTRAVVVEGVEKFDVVNGKVPLVMSVPPYAIDLTL
jgi:hypothetical protein